MYLVVNLSFKNAHVLTINILLLMCSFMCIHHINILFDVNAKLDEHNIRLVSCLLFQVNKICSD